MRRSVKVRNQKSEVRSPISDLRPPTSDLRPLTSDLRPLTSGRRGGYSLAELLIVIMIMLMLVAITLPTVKRVLEDGSVREASRQFNAYLAMAKARALQTGRPCGVMLRCDLPLGTAEPALTVPPTWPTKQITQMYLAEVPPPYSGGTTGTVGTIWAANGIANPRVFSPVAGGGVDTFEMAMLGTLIEPGEFFLVRFNFKGEWYRCVRGSAANAVYPDPTLFYFLGGALTFPPGFNSINLATTVPSPFQIIRMPRRIGNPLELSAGTCIDLAYSGIGPSNLPTNSLTYGMYPTAPITGVAPLQYLTVMFLPDGGIEYVYLNNYFFAPPTSVHFLVGKSEKLNPPFGPNASHGSDRNMFDPATSNLADPLSLWVSVSRATGNVNTSENSPPSTDLSATTTSSMRIISGSSPPLTINPSTFGDQALYLALCRQLATNREQIRGQ